MDIKDRSDVYKCFSEWQEHGLFEKILNDLATEADFQDVSIVSTIIKVNKDAGSKKRITRKTYILFIALAFLFG